MKELLIEGKELNMQGDNVWIGIGRGSSAVAIPLVYVCLSTMTKFITLIILICYLFEIF